MVKAMQKLGIKRTYFNITEVLYDKLRATTLNVHGVLKAFHLK